MASFKPIDQSIYNNPKKRQKVDEDDIIRIEDDYGRA